MAGCRAWGHDGEDRWAPHQGAPSQGPLLWPSLAGPLVVAWTVTEKVLVKDLRGPRTEWEQEEPYGVLWFGASGRLLGTWTWRGCGPEGRCREVIIWGQQ